MTRDEFKKQIKLLIETYSYNRQVLQEEKEKAGEIRQHDPHLADLICKHVEFKFDVYKYLMKKVEKDETDFGNG